MLSRLHFLAFFLTVSCSEDEFRLLHDLRDGYDPVERPVRNHSEPIRVSLHLYLQQIVDVDEKNQMLTLVLWEEFRWHDYKMRWEPRDYGGIKKICLPSSALWKPDVLLFNSADENFDARFETNFVARHDGHVLHSPPAIIKSTCRIDITWFPFDEQVCLLKVRDFVELPKCCAQFGSWTYTGNSLDLCIDDSGLDGKHHSIDLFYYVQNGEWDIVATPAVKKVTPFGDDSYVELHFYLHIRRKSVYYAMNWIVPSILFLLSNVLGFTMPPECGEKITLQTTNLLSVTVFLGMVSEITPPTSTSVPIIAAFFSVSMIILGSSIIMSLLIINVHFRSPHTHKMSPWVRTVFLEWLPWLLLMNRPGTQFRRPTRDHRRVPSSHRPHSDSTNPVLQLLLHSKQTPIGKSTARALELDERECGEERVWTRKLESVLDAETAEFLRETLTELNGYLKLWKRKLTEEYEAERAKTDWRFVAMVLDRACLFLYAFLSCVIPLWVFACTPASSLPLMDAISENGLCRD